MSYVSLATAVAALVLVVLCVATRRGRSNPHQAPLALLGLALFTQSGSQLLEPGTDLADSAKLVAEPLLLVSAFVLFVKALALSKSGLDGTHPEVLPNKALQQSSAKDATE